MHYNEHWAAIEGFPNYEVSSQGRVCNIRTGRILKANFAGRGYLQLRLCNETGCHFRRVSRLVAQAFLGPLDDGLEVNHRDGNKLDNSVDNLEIVTHQKNMQHAWANDLIPRRLKKVRCLETNELFPSVTDAANSFDVRQGSMSNHLNGRRSNIKGFHFEVVE